MPNVFCPVCGSAGPSRTMTPGSIGIELLLWLLFIVPGLIYSAWRLSARKEVCAVCGSVNVLPATSPLAQKSIIASTPPSNPSGWFYLDSSNQQNGPFSETEILKMIANKNLRGSVLVWKEGLQGWVKLSDAMKEIKFE